jgi:hypothetical protein
MTHAEKILLLIDIWTFTAVCWFGYRERRRLFKLAVAAFEAGQFAVRRSWQDDYEHVIIGEVNGREFHFRTNLNEWTGKQDMELSILDYYSSRSMGWTYGSGNLNEDRDRPILVGLAHRLRHGSIMSRRA